MLSHVFFIFIFVVIIAVDRDARPFAVYRFNVRTGARKLVRVEREERCELAQRVGSAAAKERRKLLLGAPRRRWCGEQREDVHKVGGMRDASELTRHILGAELIGTD